MSKFIHLHNHTDFSLLDAMTTTTELVEAAVEFEQPGIALTDNGVLYGVFNFQQKANRAGIKPLIGVDAYIAPGSRFEKSPNQRRYHRILLLAKHKAGYKNLVKLCSRAFVEGFYYKPRIDMELLKEYSEGLICLSGGRGGEVARSIVNSNYNEAVDVAKSYHEVFGDDFYMQVQNHSLQFDDKVCEVVPKIAKELGVKTVATNDTFYRYKEHAVAHNVHLFIKDGGKNEVDVTNLRFGSDEFYIKSSQEMEKLFADNQEAIDSTYEIFEKCDIDFKSKIYMPNFPIPESSPSENLEEYLKELVYKGLEERFDKITDEIRERTEFELKIINDMEFPGYFLVVADFIQAGRDMGVRVGPGRGSAAGSIVAYALGITNVDPLKYDLLFERFLNPDRNSMPDIDVDFADDKREKVIEYVRDKYGEEAVAMIITFGTLSTRAVLSDVGRVLQVPFSDVKNITSKIPVVRGEVTKLAEALKLSELKFVKEKMDNPKSDEDKKIKQLIEYCLILEDRKRNDSIHAAGVIIAPSDVTDYIPVNMHKNADTATIKVATQFTMKEVESAGLIKMDFLGLRTLSIIENALLAIRRNHNVDIDIDNIPLDDKKTYEIFSEQKANAIFQFESQGMQEWLRKLKPQSVEELTAMNALYRPGPMDNIGEFIDRKYGRSEITYLHEELKKSLEETYGIIVYQEQVMRIVQDVGGFTLAEADIARRAMGKKDLKTMDSLMSKFIEGAKKKGIDEKLTKEIWELILKFAAYGFNKSHAVAYSLVAYQTAYLKAHYPAEFLAANMTAELNSQEKVVKLIDDAEQFGLEVLPPDINQSSTYFEAKGNSIYFGLAGIKGVGVSVVEKILEVREEKNFDSFADFCERVDDKAINRKTLESLISAGVFDKIEDGKRACLFESIDMAIDFSKSFSNKETENIDSLFLGVEDENVQKFKLPDVPEWDQKRRLIKEKEVLNFYISGHPLREYDPLVKAFNKITFDQHPSELKSQEITVCAFISNMEVKLSKKGDPFAILTLEDYYSKAECLVWSREYGNISHKLSKDKAILIEGTIREDEDNIKIYCSNAMDVEEAVETYSDGYKIWIDLNDKEADAKLDVLKNDYYDPNTTPKQIYFNIFDESKEYKNCFKTEKFNIPLNLTVMGQLQKLFNSKVSLIMKGQNGTKRYS
jgi:DNA polymerase-3 subunit alpha